VQHEWVTGEVHAGLWQWRHVGERFRRAWDDNIKMDLQAVGWGMDCIDVAHCKDKWRILVTAVMNLSGSIKCGEFLDWLRTG